MRTGREVLQSYESVSLRRAGEIFKRAGVEEMVGIVVSIIQRDHPDVNTTNPQMGSIGTVHFDIRWGYKTEGFQTESCNAVRISAFPLTDQLGIEGEEITVVGPAECRNEQFMNDVFAKAMDNPTRVFGINLKHQR